MRPVRTIASWMWGAFSALLRFSGRNLKESFTLDGRSLALFRIGLGLLILADLAIRTPDLHVHYSDEGLLPISVLSADGRISIHLLHGSAWFQGGLFVVQASFALALLVGFQTHLATVVSWFLLLSLHARNPFVLNGGDCLFRMLLFWGMFLPLGARWSLDRALGRPAAPRLERVLSVGAVALVLQVCLMYWLSVVFKTDDSWRRNGTAVAYALHIDRMATPLGHYLLQFPRLLKVLTYSTFWFELIGPMLLFCPFWRGAVRTAAVFGFVFFHVLGLGLSLELILFSYICAVAWLAFLPAWFWDQLAARVRTPSWPARLAHWYSGETWLKLRPLAGPQVQPTPVINCLAGCLLIYVTAWNVRSVNFEKYSQAFPAQMSRLGNALGLGQKWSMFAPSPGRNDGWYVVLARLTDGTELDLARHGFPIRWPAADPLLSFAPVAWEKPALVSATFKSHRWRKFIEAMAQKDMDKYRRHWAEYLRRAWAAHYPDQPRLQAIEVYCMLERTLSPTRVADPRKTLMFAYDCTDAGGTIRKIPQLAAGKRGNLDNAANP